MKGAEEDRTDLPVIANLNERYAQAMNNRWLSGGLTAALGCLLFVAALRCEAQNLVPNHSFEEYDTCQVVNDVFYPETGPLGWFSAGWTPDHFMSCLPYGSFNGVPLNAWSFQHPQDGECYAGVTTYRQFPEGREYFMVQLLEPLVVGQQYHASFFTSPEWGAATTNPPLYLATNGIGMVFTTQSRQWELGDPIPAPLNYAHVHSQGIITDTVGWTLVSGSFVADSAYRYVMLGNPFDNAATDTLHFGSYPWVAVGGVLIDNVCVSLDPLGCPLPVGIGEFGVSRLSLFPNPTNHWVTVVGLEVGDQLDVADILGHSVWQGPARGSALHLDVRHWYRGAYVLHVRGSSWGKSLKFVLIE